MIGKIVNFRYEVLEKIGDGPLFSVYKSRDKVLNRLVALKSPVKGLQGAPGLSEAFVTAYRGVMSLAHPSIAKVFDADCVGGECFIACEYARGINVKERVRRAGPIAAPFAVDIMIPVLTALDYAHSVGIVHGDLAAQDVIVSPDGEVKVTDFGLAGVLTEHPEIADKYVMRSVHYEAPEIIGGAAPTVASDIYSAGIIIYEMLTGQLPFDGATSVAVAMKKAKDTPVNPRVINTAVPKSLSDIAMRAIETAPEDRYSSAAEMLAELKAVSHALRTGMPAAPVDFYSSGPKVARSAEEVATDAPEKTFRSQFITALVLFVVVCLIAMGATFMLKSRKNTVTVPTLLGLTWDQAQAAAKEAGVTLKDDGTGYSNVYLSGQICSVSPPPGTSISPDELVKVKVSSGPDKIPVPYVVGKSEVDARSAIEQAGFDYGAPKQEYSDTVPINDVISQDPRGGVSRPPRTTINLVVSMGPKPPTETPPPTGTDQSPGVSQERDIPISVQVPADAGGPQEVKIEVSDDRGSDNVAYQATRQPGDKFDVQIKGYGSSVDVKIYIGGQLDSDTVY